MHKKRISGLGERIKKARKKLKWTQEELALFFGFQSKATIERYEKDLRCPEEKIIEWVKKVERLTAEKAHNSFDDKLNNAKKQRLLQKVSGHFSPEEKHINPGGYPSTYSNKNGYFSPGNLHRKVASVEKFQLVEQGKLEQELEKGFEQEDKPRKRRIKTVDKHIGFQCPFCGSYITGANHYYSSLARIITMRLINLLKTSVSKDYSDAVYDCIHKIFPDGNPVAEKILSQEGQLEKYEQRHRTMSQDTDKEVKKLN